MDWFEVLRNALAVLGTLVSVGFGAWVVVQKAKSDRDTQISDEWKELAEVRGSRIEDLETLVHALETRVATLEGKYEALLELKTDEIAGRVVEMLVATRAVS